MRRTGRSFPFLGAAGALLVAVCCWTTQLPAQPADGTSSPEALAVYADAASYQNNGAFDVAIEEWERFLKDFPQDPLAAKAQYYMGVCYLQTQQLQKAIDSFRKVVQEHPRADVLEDAYLNLGWSQFSLARAGEAELYNEAANQFSELLRKFPQGKHAPQALFYLGEARYAQDNRKEAAAAYERLLQNFPQASMRCDALYALGVTREELGEYAAAGSVYDLFLQNCQAHKLATEVRMRKGETLLQTGKVDAAEKLFAEVARAEDFAAADHALMRQAFAAAQQNRYSNAAELYASLPNRFPESRYLPEARISAARSFYRANAFESAAEIFRELIERDSPYAAEAAHWLSRIHLRNDRPSDALALVDQALARSDDDGMRVQLLLDRADALYEIPERRGDALEQYTNILAEYGEHQLAPQALYNAAFVALNIGKHGQAVEFASQFIARFPDHGLSPDVRYVAAEGYLQQGEHALAEQTYRQLLEKYPQHDDIPTWQVRQLLSLYLQEKYAEVPKLAEKILRNLPTPALRAEAQFLIGASHFYQNQFAAAERALRSAMTAEARWRQADETLLLLSRTLHKLNRTDDAIATAQQVLEDYPDTELRDRVYYRLGEYFYAAERYPAATAHYAKVLDETPDSSFIPYALYGKGWSQLKQQEFAEAARAFGELIERFPEHESVTDAYFARAMSNRQAGRLEEAVRDLESYLRSDLTSVQKADALYELGLAHVSLKNHQQAAQAFERLLQENANYAHGDKVLYELAWAYKSQQDHDQAVKTFRQLTERFPDKPLAAEAYFHIGEDYYEKNDFTSAVKAYEQAQQRTPVGELGEKTDYKLGWSYFQLEQYDLALAQFNHQVLTYPEGPLYSDAVFMKAESAFRMEDYEQALAGYRAAREVKAASPQIASLTLLHAGQSAAQLEQWQESQELLKSLIDQYPDSPYLAEAYYELGWAEQNLDQSAEALEAYEEAATRSRGEVGARARFMMGEIYFGQKEYEQAVRQFQRVMFGYGAQQAPAEVKNWQAKAAFEAGRIAETQISGAQEPQRRLQLVADAKKYYGEVVRSHPQHDLAAQAQQRLQVLEKI